MTKQTENTINAQLEEIWSVLKTNEDALDSGKAFSIEGLEEKTQSVCQLITTLPREKAMEYEPEMTRMIDYLTALSVRMNEAQESLRDNLAGVNTRHTAFKAYKQANVLSKSKKDDNT